MKKDFLKKAVAAGLVASMALATAACGSEASDADKDANSNASDKVESTESGAVVEDDGSYDECTLTISWWGGDDRHEAMLAALAAFEEAYPGIKVVDGASYAAWDGWETKMSTQFMSGTECDVNLSNWNWLTQYDQDGTVFADLSDYSNIIDMSTVEDKYLELCTIDGTLKAVPTALTGRIFYWDKTTFDEVGCDIPTSYADLLAAGEAFEAYGEDYYPLSLGEYDRMILMVYYLESVYGKEWVTDGTLNYSTDEIAEGLEFIQGLEDAHVIPSIQKLAGDGADSLDKNPNWIDGHYAGIFEWDSSATKFSTAAEGREIVVGDYFEDFGDYQGGYSKVATCWTMKASTEHPKEAAMLINFLLNDESNLLGSAFGSPSSASAREAAVAAGTLNEQVAEANEKVIAWTSFSLDSTFESAELKSNPDGVYYDVMAGLSYGDYDVETAAQTLADGIQGVLDAQ
ncbi:MAG: ABC transporter substrate-binding protein [Roseburia sp.]